METAAKRERASNFELLRIVCMFFIIAHHYTVYGFVIPEGAPVTVNLVLMKLFSYAGKSFVDIFVMISGYFLVSSGPSAKKAVKLWLQVSIISAVIALCFYASGRASGLRGLVEGFFPILYSVYWFATTYFVLYLLSGYINTLIRALSREGLLGLICLLTVICSVLPTLLAARMAASNLLLFVLLYLIAAYIRLYSPRVFESRYCLAIGVGLNLLFLSVNMAAYSLSDSSPFCARLAVNFDAMEKIPTLLCAVFIFAGFKNLRMKSSRLVNQLGASTFGAYLLHHNPYMWDFWWKEVLHCPDYLNSPYMMLHGLFAILVTYAVCVVLDMFYRFCIERPMWRHIDRYWDGWAGRLRTLRERVFCLK